MDVCTIIAKNYAAFARVLARSHAEHHPGARCFVCVIDEVEGYLDGEGEPFEIVTAAQLGVERYDRMAALYNVLELSTAVKPFLLKHLLHARGLERVAYLDPDIRIFQPLGELEGLLREHQLVVTPHATEPMPRDGRKPSESDVLTSGVYNLGFVGMGRGPDTDRVLDWWAERLARDCVIDPERGFFVDQRWMDFAPGLVDSFHVLRDPGYNVAYWNLPSRALLGATDGAVTVNGAALRFFHFSGFKPDRPDQLSTHQNRIQIRPSSPLATLCADYAEALFENGYETAARWPYSYAALPNGLELDPRVRAVYRDATAAGELDVDVFTPGGAGQLLRYLNGPADVGGQSGVTRYLHALYRQHGNLKTYFPDLRGVDAVHLVAWANTDGSAGIPPSLLPSTAARPDSAQGAAPRAGVNLAGYFRSVLGVGEVARGVVDALEDQNVAVAPVGVIAGHSDQEECPAIVDRDPAYATFPINLICVNADALEGFVDRMGPDFFAGRHSIGYWWWELEQFPERLHEAFRHVDEIWCGSRHVADAIAADSPVPVVKVTVPVQPPRFPPLSRERLGLPPGFVFLFVFDYNSVFERKNPLAAVEAFKRAFRPGDGASLVLKCIGHERHAEHHRRLLAATADRPDVHVIDRALPRAEKDALIGACDAYLSLHRAEGFGIGMAEAMALGKPVIATGYSGNLEFMTADNSWLVDYELVPVGENVEFYPARALWAEPDADHAARLMRALFDDPQAAGLRAERGRAEIARSHSREAAGACMARRLVRIQDRWGLRAAGLARDTRGSVDALKLARRISRGPQPAFGREAGGPRGQVRDLVLRLMKPFTAHQRNVDESLLHAIQALDHSLQALAAGQNQLRPMVQRLLADAQALPPAADGIGLAEHPLAGVVSGYASPAGGGAAAATAGPAGLGGGAAPVGWAGLGGAATAGAPGPVGTTDLRARLDKLLGNRQPVLDLDADPAPLREARDGALGAVVAVSVAKRLGPNDLGDFFALALRKLRDDGLLVVVAPNPHSARALKTFWAEPSNARPLFPEAALALCQTAGFGSAFVFHPDGTGNVEADRFYEARYAVVAAAGAQALGLRASPDTPSSS